MPLASDGVAGGSGYSAIGRLRQRTRSGVRACAQCIGPQYGAGGWYWKNASYPPRHVVRPLGSFIQPWYGVRWNCGRSGSAANSGWSGPVPAMGWFSWPSRSGVSPVASVARPLVSTSSRLTWPQPPAASSTTSRCTGSPRQGATSQVMRR